MNTDEQLVPIGYCRYCRQMVPLHIEYWGEALGEGGTPRDPRHVTMVCCPNCDTVLNVEDDYQPKWVSVAEAEQRTGWKPEVSSDEH